MPQLRIGILAYDWQKIEPWVHRLIAQIESDERLEIVARIKANQPSNFEKVNWLYRCVNAVEQKILGRPIPADQGPFKALALRCPIIDQTSSDDLTDLKLDVLFNVDGAGNGQTLSGHAKTGLWFLDMYQQYSGLAGYDAVIGETPTARIGLSRYHRKQPNPQRIANAWVNPKFALSRNALFMKENAVVLIMRELNRVARTGQFTPLAESMTPATCSPGTVKTIRYCWHLVCEVLGRGLLGVRRKTGLRADTYFLLKGGGDVLDFDPEKAEIFMPEGNNFWADPFLWVKDGVTYCFYEHYSRATKLGHISVGQFDDNGFTVLGDVLKPDTHLSFPFLFEHQGELYMMPETCATKRIEVWRCTDFPLQWELHSTALEGMVAADSMVLRHDGKWWLFTNLATDIYRDNCSELHIFEIDGPDMKRMTPHAANPVVFDSETARNAGRLHVIDGTIYRPSQINAYGQYGYGLNIMEVEELSLEAYREKRIRKIDPSFKENLSGCHHFDAVGGQFIMDSLLKPGAKG